MKKIIGFIGLCLSLTAAFALNAPQLRCLSVNDAGEVTLSWMASTETSGFLRYEIYYTTDLAVPFTLVGQVPNLAATTSYTHVAADALNNTQCFYYVAACSASECYSSDTLSTIEFYLANLGNGLAILDWAPPINPPLSTYSTDYQIDRNLYGTWSTLASTSQLSYRDTIDICEASLGYRVQLADASGCRNVSRPLSDVFSDLSAPDIPQLDSVSVDFTNSRIRLGWERSFAEDVSAYIIYHFESGLWVPMDTVFGMNNTTWVDAVNGADAMQQYRIAALDSCLNSSPMSEAQHNIRVTSTHDLCRREATLTWEEYENMPMEVEAYRVYYSENGGPLIWAGETDGDTRTFTLQNLVPQSQYRCVIQAVNYGGNVTATSTKCEFLFNSDDNQDFCYIRYVTVVDNAKIEIKVSTGTTVSFSKVHLYRSAGDDQHFVHYAEQTNDGTDTYVFEDDAVQVDKFYYYYRAAVENDCDVESAQSNVAHNIILRGEVDNEARQNLLEWDTYDGWNGGVAGYSVYRQLESTASFDPVTLTLNANNYQDDVTSHRRDGENFTYFVEAEESAGDLGFMEKSRSNTIELKQLPQTYIPNAFCPRAGGQNSVFKPVNSYVTMENYNMWIYSREGTLVFHTTDPNLGWNGGYNGDLMPTACYVYIISYTYGTDGEFEASGTVTLIR